MLNHNNSFIISKEIQFVILVAVFSLLLIRIFNIDFVIADFIYSSSEAWQYRNAWFTNQLMHRWGKYLFILMYLLLVTLFFFRDRQNESKHQRFGKIVLLVSILIGTLLVSVLKHSLEVDCPWDLINYGGTKPYYDLFNYAASALPSSHCFPSGHASTVFTWISLYFYLAIYYPQHKSKALFCILLIGFIFGAGQQIRGAHFISHDIWSMLVCIVANIIVYKLAFGLKQLKLNKVSLSDFA
jgi:membrane-associated PAP2 superfamily phosphatase